MNILITLTGPTCSGKSHLQDLLTGPGHRMGTVITATTRAPRKGEVDGIDYHFLSDEQFTRMVEEGAFVESTQFSGARYGTPVASLKQAFEMGRGRAAQVIEPQGVRAMHEAFKTHPALQECRLLPVFLHCPFDVVANRFMQRYRADLGDALARTPGNIETITRYYERRLVSILTVEVGWRQEALDDQRHGCQLYELVVDEFGAESEGYVLGRILERIL